MSQWRLIDRLRLPALRFQRHLRYVEYVNNCKRGKVWAPYRSFCKWRLRIHGTKLGFTIPLNVFGPGLCIVHTGTLVVTPSAKVGAHCRINVDCCIGVVGDLAPRIGDNAYIAVGAKIIGGVTLGNNVRVGANAVVTKSFGDNVTLVGVPAHLISHSPTIEGESTLMSGLII
jgi:serine O-acetyltransferase